MCRRIFKISFRKVNENYILRDWITFREGCLLGYITKS